MKSEIKTVGDHIADFLAERGIKHVFGIIGAGNVNLFEAIAKKGFTEIVCVHHEQAACMAMQTYYRVNGQITASLLTTGAGSTNGITGVVSAWADSIPGVIISGNENSKYVRSENPLRMYGVQGYDSSGMVESVCKHVSRVYDPKDTLRELNKAFITAGEGRPGPCWIDIPMDIQSAKLNIEDFNQEVQHIPVKPTLDIDPHLENLIQLISASERPILWLGHGIRLANAQSLVSPLLKTLKIPTLVSWAGIDIVDSDNEYVFGRAGVYGQRCANFVLQNSDLIIAIGTRLAIPQIGYDISELARGAKLVHVDIDPLELNKLGARTHLSICSDAKSFVHSLLEKIKMKSDLKLFGDWINYCNDLKRRYPWVNRSQEHKDTDGFINSYGFIDKLNECLKTNQIIVTDMGTALLSGHQALRIKAGQRLMTSTGLGEMGYGIPGAIGASFASQKGEVLCLNCDGGMMLNLQELQTIAHHNLPIKIIVFNNDGYLMIKHTQKSLFGKSQVGVDKKSGVSCPDFSKIARAFDFKSFQIRTWEDCDRILPLFQEHDGPVICEVFMDPIQGFLPKLSLKKLADGTLVSPPLEDLTPFLPRAELAANMLKGIHPKSGLIQDE